jgi:rod shape determining protein RodA
MKLILILVLARFLGAWRRDWRTLRTPAAACVLAGIPFVLVARQPDLGTAAILPLIAAAMLWLGGLRMRHLVLGLLLVVLALSPIVAQIAHYQTVYLPAREAGETLQTPFWYILKPYQCDRLLVFLDPARDPLNTGWSLMQSRIAIGSGGWVGKGWLQGTQNVLGFLPRTVAPTDFIFSVVAEETGFIGASILVGVYGILLTSCARVAAGARDQYGRLIAVGVSVLILCHVYVNIGMTVGLMPVTGLPLPLVSYGGSFLVSILAGIGLVQSVYIRRHEI